jgi:hypothetical protein
MYRTLILPVVLYGCETWSQTLREKRSQRVFENRVLRRIFWPERDEINGECWLHNEELYALYSSPNTIQVIKSRRPRLAGHVARMGRREMHTRCIRPDRPWGPPSLLYIGYQVSFPVVKRSGRGSNHPPQSSAEVNERVELYLYSLLGLSQPPIGWTLLLPPHHKSFGWSSQEDWDGQHM